jgi:hypothetical protein
VAVGAEQQQVRTVWSGQELGIQTLAPQRLAFITAPAIAVIQL